MDQEQEAVVIGEPRSIEGITQEYNKLCAQSGDAAYRIECIKEEIEKMWVKMRELNVEAAELMKKQEAAKKESN